MITKEKIIEILNNDDIKRLEGSKDHTFLAISLLREKIPYSECHEIITAALNDTIWFGDIDLFSKYLDESDIITLAQYNTSIDEEQDALYLFI